MSADASALLCCGVIASMLTGHMNVIDYNFEAFMSADNLWTHWRRGQAGRRNEGDC